MQDWIWIAKFDSPYRQNEVEILPNWFIYRKEEISFVKAVANKKGFRR